MESLTSLAKALGNLSLANKSVIEVNNHEDDYVLDLAVQNCGSDPYIAAACSNFTIHLLSKARLAQIFTISGHKNTVTKVQFGKTDVNLLYTCSKDKTVRCWDPRVSTSKEVQLFQAPSAINADILSLDISHSDRLLCAGTENVNNDSYLVFWDNRQHSLLGCYNECHQDDITQVCFQPGSDRYLASGSADGLVCTFDLAETSEDDALQITLNAESDVARVGWCGQNSSDCVYCVTSDNSFYVWDAFGGENYCTINSFDGSLEAGKVDYIIDAIPELSSSGDRSTAVLLTGTYSGHLQLRLCTDQSTDSQTLATLNSGHTATVRCSHWDSETQTLLTGGEDSLVCLWSADPSTQLLSKGRKTESQGKIKGKINVSDHSRKPYSKKK